MTTIATLFSGGECVGIGARNAGLTHLWGVEHNNDIANVARQNGFHVITSDVMDIDPHTMPIPDVLHASPVCKRASVANQSAELNEDGTKESPEDIATGQKVAQFIDVMMPRIMTIENVSAYRHFKAFKIITAALDRNGYMWDFDNLNAADYGVPQTRRRLILRAKRGALLPMLPQSERWVSWFSAIEDLIPGLPESQFAAWQLARLPEEIREAFLMPHDNMNTSRALMSSEPSQTIPAHGRGAPKAFILAQGKYGDDLVRTDDSQPVFTVTANSNQMGIRAWLSQGRVVRMTPRALARFMSLPDSYILPDNSRLACTVIGNGVPCLLYQKIIAALI